MQRRLIAGTSLGVALAIAGCSKDENASSNGGGGCGGQCTAPGGSGGGGASPGGAPQGGRGGQGGPCSPPEGPHWNNLKTTAERLYQSDNILDGYTIDGGYLYFYERSKGVSRMPEAGGVPQVLLPITANPDYAGHLFLTATHLYYTTFPVTGADPTEMARVTREQWLATPERLGAPLRAGLLAGFVAVDDAAIYGYDSAKSELWKQDFPSGTSTALATGVQITGLALDGGFVYFADDTFGAENVSRIPVAGGAREPVTNDRSSSVGAVGVFGGHVYWSASDSIFDAAIGDPGSTKVLGHTGPGAFGNYASVEEFTVRGPRLYWRDDGQSVGWTNLDGSACGTVMTDVVIDVALGTDHLFVYILGFPNEFWRTPL